MPAVPGTATAAGKDPWWHAVHDNDRAGKDAGGPRHGWYTGMDDFLERLRDLAEELAFAHFEGPPVDPYVLAERLGVEIEPTPTAPPHYALTARGPVIHLPEDLPPERARFMLAHEIIEVQGALAVPPLTIDPGVADNPDWLLQAGASELLMPREWFEREGEGSDWDLAYLRERFEVSWEAATRRVPICTTAVGTIIDNHRISVRVAGEGLRYPPGLLPEERAAVEAVYAAWPSPAPVHSSLSAPPCRISAWPALPERNNIRRVCLLTHPEEWGAG